MIEEKLRDWYFQTLNETHIESKDWKELVKLVNDIVQEKENQIDEERKEYND